MTLTHDVITNKDKTPPSDNDQVSTPKS